MQQSPARMDGLRIVQVQGVEPTAWLLWNRFTWGECENMQTHLWCSTVVNEGGLHRSGV